jgi:hypothetical protein
MQQALLLKTLKNQKGSLTLDFMFALVLVLGVSGLFFALSFTLSVVEISQYIAFATSRNYMAAHFDETNQKQQAEAKFAQLTENTPLKVLFKNNSWFKLTYVETGDFREKYPADASLENDNITFWGTQLDLQADVLDFKIPMYGSTNEDGNAFKTKVNSFLGREVTSEECNQFYSQRWQNILNLDRKFSVMGQKKATVIFDNGC